MLLHLLPAKLDLRVAVVSYLPVLPLLHATTQRQVVSEGDSDDGETTETDEILSEDDSIEDEPTDDGPPTPTDEEQEAAVSCGSSRVPIRTPGVRMSERAHPQTPQNTHTRNSRAASTRSLVRGPLSSATHQRCAARNAYFMWRVVRRR